MIQSLHSTFFPPPFPRSLVGRAVATLSFALDRSDDRVRVYQDLIINLSLFGFTIYAMHRWGHKLAV